MIENLQTFLPIIIDILLMILLVIGIIIGIKCIHIMDKAKEILLNVEDKVNSLNALFSVVNIINDKVALISEKVSLGIENLISKLFSKHNEEEILEEEVTKKVKKRKG